MSIDVMGGKDGYHLGNDKGRGKSQEPTQEVKKNVSTGDNAFKADFISSKKAAEEVLEHMSNLKISSVAGTSSEQVIQTVSSALKDLKSLNPSCAKNSCHKRF